MLSHGREATSALDSLPFVAAWVSSDTNPSSPPVEHHAAVLDLITRLLGIQQLDHARNTAARLIAEHLGADFVAIGSSPVPSAPCSHVVMAGSRPPGDDRREDIEAALGECALTARPHWIDHTASSRADTAKSLAGFGHRRLFKQLPTATSIRSMPLLTSDSRGCGACLVAWSDEGSHAAHELFLAAIALPLAELFNTLQRATPGKAAQRWRTIKEHLTPQRKRGLAAIVIAAILIGLIPTRYPVRAEVTIQPSVRRWIVSPFDGPLKKSYVLPGQAVKVGELLFTIDCEDTLSKLASLRAEYEGSVSERSAHLASGRLSEAAIAGWNAKRIASEMELLTKHLERSEIRSPIAGVILGEDLQRLEGSPLKLGQTLIEVARIDQMHAAIEIPPDQIHRIRTGSDVAISVVAAGSLPTLTVSYIHPRAEPNEKGRYAFQGRAEVPGNQPQVKPGMRGQATVYGEYRPFAWCLFQRLWQGLRDWGQV